MNAPVPRPRPDMDHVREAIKEHPAGQEQEEPDARDTAESDERAEPDERSEREDPAEELDLDLPPNESAPGHNPDTDEDQ